MTTPLSRASLISWAIRNTHEDAQRSYVYCIHMALSQYGAEYVSLARDWEQLLRFHEQRNSRKNRRRNAVPA